MIGPGQQQVMSKVSRASQPREARVPSKYDVNGFLACSLCLPFKHGSKTYNALYLCSERVVLKGPKLALQSR